MEEAWESTVDAADNAADDVTGWTAETLLHGASRVGKVVGFEHSPPLLDHYLEGSGMDREIPRDEARKREPVKIGELQNRRAIEESIRATENPKPGSGRNRSQRSDFSDQLLKIKDGETIEIAGSRGLTKHTGIGGPKSPHQVSYDEQVASGKTRFRSTVPDGLRAVRKGDRVTVYGTVHHQWNDKYDFKKNGFLPRVAVAAQEHGDAREYTNRSHWRQGLRAEFQIINGRLMPLDFDWTDHPQEADLR